VSLFGNRRRLSASHPVWFLVACALALTPAFAADASVKVKNQEALVEENLPSTNIKIDVPLVLINVTVTDPMNRFVTGLEKEHFEIKEDKVDQTITQFGAEDAPLSMGIVFDASGSMGYKMSKAREAVAQFFKTANPEDEFFLAQFNDRPQMVTGFTNSLEEIQNELTFTQSKGRTALLDAIYLALNKMKEAKNSKKALL
jgi:VWFA-related protein